MKSSAPSPVLSFLTTLWRSLASDRKPLLFGFFLISINVVFIVGLPLYYRVMMDEAVVLADLDLLQLMVFWLALAFAISSLSAVLQTRVFSQLSSTVTDLFRQQMFSTIQSQHAEQNSSSAASHFSADLGAIDKWLAQPSRVILIHASVLLISALLLFWVEWRLALFTYAIIPLILFTVKWLSRPTVQHSSERKQKEEALASFISEEVRSQTMIRLFGLTHRRQQQFAEQASSINSSGRKAAFWGAMTGESSIILINLIQIGVFGLGAWLTIVGDMTLGSLIAYIGLMINISNAGITLSQLLPQLFDAASAFSRIQPLLKPTSHPTPAVSSEGEALHQIEHIELQNLSFSYGEKQVLQDISLQIKQGEQVALVGASGSGKSTLLSLLMGLQNASGGALLINGRPLSEWQANSYQKRLATVFQQPFLLEGSIADNIRCGQESASMDEVIDAAKQAEIDTIIETLPSGYDTPVGESGGRLSGGQQQRIAIARALIRKPDCLVLDEATSALDVATEQALIKTLTAVGQGRTLIAVTHRLALATAMKRIIVLDQGRIVEDGTHQSLLEKNGFYANLWQKQNLTHTDENQTQQINIQAILELPPLKALKLNEILDEKNLSYLFNNFTQETLHQGDWVIRQGEEADGFRVILRGQVEVIREENNQEQRIAVLEEGDFFGEGALLNNSTRMASVRATEVTRCLLLPREAFEAVVKSSPALHSALNKVFQARVKETHD